MVRESQEGTPKADRTRAYVMPSRSRRLLWSSVAASSVVALAVIILYFAGVRQTLRPGSLASQHAALDIKCAQCHEAGNAVTAVRCERCHDSAGSDRMVHAAHVLLGTGDRLVADAAQNRQCQSCHVEHRGRTAMVQAVDDRECGSCHAFSSFARHPEFAVVRAQATAGVGMQFDHDRHLVEVQKNRGATCQVCHEPTPDRAGFQPIAFDRHCASCHTNNGFLTGDTDFIDPALVVLPAALPDALRAGSVPDLRANPRGKQQAVRLRHRDRWVLFNAMRLRRSIDREGDDTERLAVRARISYLEQLQRARPVVASSTEELSASIDVLERELADLDARLAAPRSGNADAEALAALRSNAQAVLGQLQKLGAASSQPLPAAGGASPASQPPPVAAGASAEILERRKSELRQLLEAVTKRTSDAAIRRRVEQLSTAVDSLRPADSDAADAGALLGRLNALDVVFRAVRGIPDTGVQSQLANIDLLRQFARQRIGLGLSAEDFDVRRRELLSLLDAIDARGGDAVRVRSSELRQRVLALRPGSQGDIELRRVRQRRLRQLERLRLERELLQSADATSAPAVDAGLDLASTDRTLQRLRADLADLENVPRMPVAADADERSLRSAALDALLAPCLKCHEYDPSGARLAPVRIAEPVMPRSVFNHLPHITQTTCETCHGSMKTSAFATDVNVPGVASCAACHAPSKTRSNCATCHIYHPRSMASLVAFR
jgi:hypothetical protein